MDILGFNNGLLRRYGISLGIPDSVYRNFIDNATDLITAMNSNSEENRYFVKSSGAFPRFFLVYYQIEAQKYKVLSFRIFERENKAYISYNNQTYNSWGNCLKDLQQG